MFALINTKMTDSNVDPLCYMKLDNEEMTGFGKGSKSIYITLSVLGILVNIGFLFSSVFKQKKKTGKNKISSLERLLVWLTIIEIGISIIWVIQTGRFNSNKAILNYCSQCKVLAIVTVFLYISDWVILGLTIKQFKQIMLNPLDAILKPDQNIKKYLFIAFTTAGVACVLAWFGELTGISVSRIYNTLYRQ